MRLGADGKSRPSKCDIVILGGSACIFFSRHYFRCSLPANINRISIWLPETADALVIHQLRDIERESGDRIMKSKILTVFFIILVYHFGGFSHLIAAQSPPPVFDRSEVHWNRLAFKSNNFLGNVTTRVVLKELPADEAKSMLIPSPQGEALQPSGAGVLHLIINSAVDPLFGSDELLVSRIWFSPQEATALQRIRLRKGREQWEKTYRWTRNGVYRLRLKPEGDAEEELPLERWTNRKNSFYAYDLEPSKCSSVSEPSALLYVVSAAGLTVGDQPRYLCVFNKKQLHLVQFQAKRSQLIRVNYIEKSQQGETRRTGQVEVLKISFTTRSLFADKTEAEPFSFLGLKGNFDIFIEKTSRLPVQISGNIPGFGNVASKLEKVFISPEKK